MPLLQEKKISLPLLQKIKEYNTSIPKNREKTMPILRCFLGLTNKKLAM